MNEDGTSAGRKVVRSEGWLLLTDGLRLAAAVSMAVVAVVPGLGGPTSTRVLLGVAAAAVAAIAFRTFLGGVFVDGDGLFVRNPLRSWQLRWDDIEDVGPRQRSPLVSLRLRDGKRIALCAWGWPSSARREQLASLLLAARPPHSV